MDTDQLLSHSRARFEHATARRVLKEKYQAKMTFAYAGGMWRAGPELINTLNCCTGNDAVILDLYETPVRVAPVELKNLAQQRWQEQLNAWLVEYQTTSQKR
jgi:glycogen debranching enzyme